LPFISVSPGKRLKDVFPISNVSAGNITLCRKQHINLISNFRRVLYVVCFLLGNYPASEFYMPTFRNTLFHLHRQVGKLFTYLPMKMEQTERSEMSAYKIQTPGNYPEENMHHKSCSCDLCVQIPFVTTEAGYRFLKFPVSQQGREYIICSLIYSLKYL
jgi:hypothetical protein